MLHRKLISSVSEWVEQAQRAEQLVGRSHHQRHGQGPGSNDPSSNTLSDPNLSQDNSKERRKKKEKLRRQRNSNQNHSSKSFSNPNPLKDVTCYTCNQKGHYSRDKKYSKYTE